MADLPVSIEAITGVADSDVREIRYNRSSITLQDSTKSFQKIIFNKLETLGLEMSDDTSGVHLSNGKVLTAEEKLQPGGLFLISQDTQKYQQMSEMSLNIYNNLREVEKSLEKMV